MNATLPEFDLAYGSGPVRSGHGCVADPEPVLERRGVDRVPAVGGRTAGSTPAVIGPAVDGTDRLRETSAW